MRMALGEALTYDESDVCDVAAHGDLALGDGHILPDDWEGGGGGGREENEWGGTK